MREHSTIITVGLPAEMMAATPDEIRGVMRGHLGNAPGKHAPGWKVNKAIRIDRALAENIRFFADHYGLSVTDYTYHLLINEV